MNTKIIKTILFFSLLILFISSVSADCYYSGSLGYHETFMGLDYYEDPDEGYLHWDNCHLENGQLTYEACIVNSERHTYVPDYDNWFQQGSGIGEQGLRYMCDACTGIPGCQECPLNSCSDCYGSEEPEGDEIKFYQCIIESDGSLPDPIDECHTRMTYASPPVSIFVLFNAACNPDRCDSDNYGYHDKGSYVCGSRDVFEMLTSDIETEEGICTTNEQTDGSPACSIGKVCNYYISPRGDNQPYDSYVEGCSSGCIENKSNCDKDVWTEWDTVTKSYVTKSSPGFQVEGHCAPDRVCNNYPSINQFLFFEFKESEDNRKLICNVTITDPDLVTLEDTNFIAKMDIKYRYVLDTEYTDTLFSGSVGCNLELDNQRAVCTKEIDICAGVVELERDYICNVTPYDGHEDGITKYKELTLWSAAPYVYYVNITPDYYDLFAGYSTVTYTNIFGNDPMYYCEFEVNDTDCMDDMLTCYYSITGLTWPNSDEEENYRIEGSMPCHRETLYKIPIPQENIRPNDYINCKIYAEDQWGIESSEVSNTKSVPEFDLMATNIAPIQVIQGSNLVKDKRTMARLYHYLYSDLITEASGVGASAKLKNTWWPSTTFLAKNYLSLSQAIQQDDAGAVMDLKNAGNTINFQSILAPYDSGSTTIEALGILNPGGATIKESTLDNNNVTRNVPVAKMRRGLRLIFIPIEIGSWRSGYNPAQYNDVIDGNVAFLKEIFPLPDSLVNVEIRTTPYVPENDSSPSILYLRKLVYKIKMFHSSISRYDTRVVGVIPPDAFPTDVDGIASKFTKKSVMISSSAPGHTLSHEISHTYGIHNMVEEYNMFLPWGLLADDGWRISKSEPIINLNKADRDVVTDIITLSSGADVDTGWLYWSNMAGIDSKIWTRGYAYNSLYYYYSSW